MRNTKQTFSTEDLKFLYYELKKELSTGLTEKEPKDIMYGIRTIHRNLVFRE